MKKLLAMLALLAMAAPAMADYVPANQIDSQHYKVGVNIDVQAEVSMWANDSQINLVMDGATGNNTDFAVSSLTHINNAPAVINVKIEGSLPDPFGGDGIQFYIWDGALDATAAEAKVNVGAGIVAHGNSSFPVTVNGFKNVPISNTTSTFPITYGVASPSEIPAVGVSNLTLTWEIAPQ